jgi:hypothetical protein
MWIPAIRNHGGKLVKTLTVIDRDQGGSALLAAEGVKLYSMFKSNAGFFRNAAKQGHIGAEQLDLILGYLEDPHRSMRSFLIEHPDFLLNSLAADEKTAKRAKMCVENDLYDLH